MFFHPYVKCKPLAERFKDTVFELVCSHGMTFECRNLTTYLPRHATPIAAELSAPLMARVQGRITALCVEDAVSAIVIADRTDGQVVQMCS